MIIEQGGMDCPSLLDRNYSYFMTIQDWHAYFEIKISSIIICFHQLTNLFLILMEAERLNTIAHRIADLSERETALRGYL